MRITICKDDGEIYFDRTTDEIKKEFDEDELCKKEGLTMPDEEAVEALADEVKEEALRLFRGGG